MDQTLDTVTLEQFEGPVDFLLYLIQKHEIDIYEVSLHEITGQFLKKLSEIAALKIDMGAEFVSATAKLLHLKSKLLLPDHGLDHEPIEAQEEQTPFALLHKLVDYCKIKQAAQDLSERETEKSGRYPRPYDEVPHIRKGLGIEHIDIDEISRAFQKALSSAKIKKGTIQEEFFRVSDKIDWIRDIIKETRTLLCKLFSPSFGKQELIVTFLAVLELMKNGEVCVTRETKTKEIILIASPKRYQ